MPKTPDVVFFDLLLPEHAREKEGEEGEWVGRIRKGEEKSVGRRSGGWRRGERYGTISRWKSG